MNGETNGLAMNEDNDVLMMRSLTSISSSVDDNRIDRISPVPSRDVLKSGTSKSSPTSKVRTSASAQTTTTTTTPRGATSKRRVQAMKSPSTLIDQLEILMSQSNESMSSSKQKNAPKVVQADTELDKSIKDDSSSEYNNDGALSNSERSSSKQKKKNCTRSKDASLPKIPRSPHRKKTTVSSTGDLPCVILNDAETSKVLKSPFSELALVDNKIHVKYCNLDDTKIPLSPNREKRSATLNSIDISKSSNESSILIECKMMGTSSEKSTRSSSSLRKKMIPSRNENESNDGDVTLKMKSTSERTVKSSTTRQRRIDVQSDNDEAQTTSSERSSVKSKSSFRMEPVLSNGSSPKQRPQRSNKLAEHFVDAGQIIRSVGVGESVSSVEDEATTAPLLLERHERSESITMMRSSSGLSDDILGRLNRSSLSDIEKSGIGVERSIKKAIQAVKKKKTNESNGAKMVLLPSKTDCSSDDLSFFGTIHQNLPNDGRDSLMPSTGKQVQLSEEDQNDLDFNRSIIQDTGLLIENLQEFIVEGDGKSGRMEKEKYQNMELVDEYIEEVLDDDDDDEVATMNSSMQLSIVAAEMDEAMSKVWAKFDSKLCQSSNHSIEPVNKIIAQKATAVVEQCEQQVVASWHNNDPNNSGVAVVTETLGQPAAADLIETRTTTAEESSITVTTNDVMTTSISTPILRMESSVSSVVETIPMLPFPIPREINNNPVIATMPTNVLINTMKQPDDTRLSSLVKLLVVDAWSSNIDTVTTCLEEMTHVCATDETAVTELFQHGGHLVVIVAMRQHRDNAKIQIAALATLQKAAECRNEFTEAIIALGALELIMFTMKNHAMNENVVTAGCGALLNLTLPAKHAKVFVFELNGIHTISVAATTFPTKLALQKYVLWMIQYFSYWEDYKIQIVQQGGMQALAKMIESFSSMMNRTIDVVTTKSDDDNDDYNNRKTAIESIVKTASTTMKRLL